MPIRRLDVPVKLYGPPDSPARYEWAGGVTWIAHPEESMERASHAIVVDADGSLARDPDRNGEIWIVDPVDFDGLDALVGDLGTLVGVVVLSELHRRDSAAIANRHDVPIFVPAPVEAVGLEYRAPVRVFGDSLPGTDIEARQVMARPPYTEVALYDAATGTLVATESLVTAPQAVGWGERLSVGPWGRLKPPRAALSDVDVDRILVGHGPPLTEDAQEALDVALRRSRWGLPLYLLKDAVFMLRVGYVAKRDRPDE